MSIVPTSREEWEQVDDLDRFSDKQLKDALQEHFGLRSHVYFMPVAKKKEYIRDPDQRPQLQAEAEERQRSHQKRGAEHRNKPSVAEMVEERSEDRTYEFVGVDRPEGGFTDPFNDRSGKIAYVIRDTGDGELFPTQKQTCKVLDDLGRLSGFDPSISARKQKPAHKAGYKTVEDVIAGSDPAALAVAAEIEPKKPEKPEPKQQEPVPVDESPISSDRASALEEILDSIPQ